MKKSEAIEEVAHLLENLTYKIIAKKYAEMIVTKLEKLGMLPPIYTTDKLPEGTEYSLFHDQDLCTAVTYYRVTPENEEDFEVIENHQVLMYYPKWEPEE